MVVSKMVRKAEALIHFQRSSQSRIVAILDCLHRSAHPKKFKQQKNKCVSQFRLFFRTSSSIGSSGSVSDSSSRSAAVTADSVVLPLKRLFLIRSLVFPPLNLPCSISIFLVDIICNFFCCLES